MDCCSPKDIRFSGRVGVVGVFVSLFLAYLTAFSVNIFLALYLENLTYILLEAAGFAVILVFIVNNGVSVRVPTRIFIALSALMASGGVSAFFAHNVAYHFFYFFSFFTKILLLFLVVGGNYCLPNERTLRRGIRFVLLFTLFWSILHLKIGSGRPGWLWPINISIQEITLLVLFCSLLMLSKVSKEFWVLVVFSILLVFRSSGKTALILLWSIPLMTLLMRKSSLIRWVVEKYVVVYFTLFTLAILGVCIFFSNDISSQYLTYRDTIIADRIPFWKRLSLIVEGLYHLSISMNNLFFGAGYGYPNYLARVDSYLENTPQLFVLTLMVYGGVFLAATYCFILYLFVSFLLSRVRLDFYGYSLCYIAIAVMVTFFTTHEYFNNPFVFAALVVFIVSAKVRSRSLVSGA